MILRGITLENFRLYAGTTKIDLVPRRRNGRESAIILIGGKNGAGKTITDIFAKTDNQSPFSCWLAQAALPLWPLTPSFP